MHSPSPFHEFTATNCGIRLVVYLYQCFCWSWLSCTMFMSSKVVFRQRSFSLKGFLPPKVVFHQMSSYIKGKGHLPSKAFLHQRLAFFKECLPLSVISHWMLSSIEGCHPLKAVLHWMYSSIEGCLPWPRSWTIIYGFFSLLIPNYFYVSESLIGVY